MTGAAPPPTERILRQLFWRLLVRGRNVAHEGHGRKRKGLSFTATCLLYGAMGIIPAATAFRGQPIVFASLMHGFTLLFAAMTLAASAGSLLLAREEAEILLHRPVPISHLLRAKAWVLFRYSLLLALALNLAGLVTGMFGKGIGWLWLPAHLATTTLMMVFATALIVLVYNLCLRWFGRERLDNLLTAIQTLLTVAMIVGSQLAPRFLGEGDLDGMIDSGGFGLLAPPIWFAALDLWLCGAASLDASWLPAGLAVGSTAGIAWLAFDRLAGAYGRGLASLGEGAVSERDHGGRRLMAKLAASPLLRWWLRDPIERQAFVLASAYLGRDRETKLKIYPALAPMMILPIVMMIRPGKDAGAIDTGLFAAIGIGYIAILPLVPLMALRRSEHFRAAEVFRYAPLPSWAPLFHGFRKAILLWLALPACIVMVGLIWLISGSSMSVWSSLPLLMAMPIYSLVPTLAGPWLPLSEPNQDGRDASIGCLVTAVVIGSGVTLSGVSAWLSRIGLLLPFLVAVAVASTAIYWLWHRRIATRTW
ncbi:MAG: hypothetical protein KDC98_12790 [Planctomycetes bacterium]|nr:hypothetical protein [Planctomycetota bacterium]